MSQSLLQLRGIHKRYGPIHVLRGVNLDLNAGEVLALIGENGAGKSTLVKILTGVVPFDEGTIELKDENHRFQNAQASQAAGIMAVHQETVMFDELTVAENIYVGRYLKRGVYIDWPSMHLGAQEVLNYIGARFTSKELVKNLSLAERHLVELARALSQKASIVILDEPTAALSQAEIRDFYGIVRKLRADGVGIIFISHKFDEIFSVADKYLVLRDGMTVGAGEIANTTEQQLVKLMAGREIDQIYPKVHSQLGEVVLNVVGLTHPTEFHNVSFTLRRGEILGFYGLVGAGRSEAMRAIMGLNPNATGHLEMCGKRLVVKKPGDAIAAGIAYVPEERQRQGGILSFSVQHNISLAGLKRFANMGWLSHSKETSISHRMIERLRIKTSTQDTLLSGLSGGNQQKVVIGKWLGLDPQIVILDEPTKGIDVGAKQAVYQLIVEMVNQGLAVILVSSELPEVLNLAHRTIVMRRGLQVAEFSKEDVRAENVVAAASGLDRSHTVIEEVSA